MKEIPIDIRKRIVFKSAHGNSDSDIIHYPPIDHITHAEVICEDCPNLVKDRRIEMKLNVKPTAHWKTTCKNCGKIQHPLTKEFSLDQNSYRSFLSDHLLVLKELRKKQK